MDEDIRWKQRFVNFEKAFKNLDYAFKISDPDILQKAGIIQFFEICLELGWKVMKDYLEEKGIAEIHFPRDIIKKSFEVQLIENGASWLEALKNRNLTSHTYDEVMADKVINDIKTRYFIVLKDLYTKLKSEV
ncbi:MAG: nucleotidyltransferase substrate binding protein [Saprospiraceae bacterium]|nr:nucleotidyltransferase substrate binding protein [Saprospiraceae bacterium]